MTDSIESLAANSQPSIPAVALLSTASLKVMFANADFTRVTGLTVGMRCAERLPAEGLQALSSAVNEALTSGASRLVDGSFCLGRDPLWSLQAVPMADGITASGMVFLIAAGATTLTQTRTIERRDNTIDRLGEAIDSQGELIDRQGTTIESQGNALVVQADRLDSQSDTILDQGDRLDQQARLLKLLMTHVPWGVIVADAGFRIDRMSDYADRLLGHPGQNSAGTSLGAKGTSSHIFHEDGTEARFEELPLFRAITDGQAITGEEWWAPDETGRKRRAILCSAAPIRDEKNVIVGGITTFGDITPLKDMVAKLHSLLDQKDVFLSELHHRVKNNLQTVASIAIAEKMRHPEAAEAIDSIIGYVSTIGAIHETLGLAPDASLVPFGGYARKICQELRHLYCASAVEIVVTGEQELPLDVATPLGLIINELVSNSLKHAFAGRAAGAVDVSLALAEETYVLEVADDGIGLPAEGCQPSLGLRLVDRLVQQLGGTSQSISNPGLGTTWRIRFPKAVNARLAAAP